MDVKKISVSDIKQAGFSITEILYEIWGTIVKTVWNFKSSLPFVLSLTKGELEGV